MTVPGPGAPEVAAPDVREARRRLIVDALGIGVSAGGFGFVYGLAASKAGFSVIEAQAMSLFGFAGAAQFAVVGYVASGLPWALILVLTFFLNARHLLYAAALAPLMRTRPLAERAVAAHLLTDESFALVATHIRRLGRLDMWGYWLGAVGVTLIPWNLATLAGATIGGSIPDPARFGLDIVFPAAMLGLAVGLVTVRRELVAAGAGGVIGLVVSLAVGPQVGIIAGGLIGPLVAMTVHLAPEPDRHAGDPLPLGTVDVEQAFRDVEAGR
jgi:predicted branched-subunit amino acid permease